MDIAQLKLVMETIQSVSGDASTAAIIYFLVPLLEKMLWPIVVLILLGKTINRIPKITIKKKVSEDGST